MAGGKGITVLVAEDDEEGRALIRRALQSEGYNIVEAKDGQEALQLFQQHSANIDLLICDVVMPIMDGRLLAQLATAIQPGIKVIFVSARPVEAVATNANYLQKPFALSTLTEMVHKVLNG